MRLLLLIFCFVALSAQSVLDKIALGKEGSYAVYQQGSVLTILHLTSNKGDTLILSEYQVDSKKAPPIGHFADWFRKKEKDVKEHITYTIHKKHQSITGVFSNLSGKHLNCEAFQSTFGTLLRLDLNELSKEQVRKVGPPPRNGEPDRRKMWIPPCTVMGKKGRAKASHAFGATWPSDHSELAQKKIEAYFSSETPFPLWIQVLDPAITYKLALKDSGQTTSN